MGEIVTCDACGAEKEVKPAKIEKNDHHFCDRDCYHTWKSEDWVPPWTVEEHPTIVCEYCGEEEQVRPYEEDERRFCSHECSAKHQSELRGPETNNYQGGKITTFCRECGQPFGYYPDGRDMKQYCSQECYAEALSDRMEGDGNHVWRGGWEYYYGPNWDEQREKALKRDDYTCQRCGKHQSEQERSLDVHHEKRLGWFKEEYDEPEWWEKGNRLENLTTLCISCHKEAEWK